MCTIRGTRDDRLKSLGFRSAITPVSLVLLPGLMRPKSIAEFTDLLQRSRLLTEDELASLPELGATSPEQLARRLVRKGWLTRWQGLTLLEGRCQFFIGKYKLLELIGTGGMGAVFKAIRPDIGRVVAVKVLKPRSLKKSTGVPRFLREIQSAATLDHPNIVRAYDADEANGTYLLVMEYIEGRDLKNYITSDQPMSLPWICECMRQAALGLQHAAENGMVHRDIKPANLMVCQADSQLHPVVKILDFGLARFVSETEEDGGLTRVGQAVGTPDYIAPEQAQNSKSADVRADIYSLGCTFFELLTGQIPFPTENLTEKLLQRVSQEAPRVRTLRPEIPREIDEIVARMMRRNPAERYATPAELAAVLWPHSLAGQSRARTGDAGSSGSADQQSDWEFACKDFQKFIGNLSDDSRGSEGSRSNGVASSPSGISLGGSVEFSSNRNPGDRRFWRVTSIVGGLGLLALAIAFFAPRSRPSGGPQSPERESARRSKAVDDGQGDADESPETGLLVDLLSAGLSLQVEVPARTRGSQPWPHETSSSPRRHVLEVDHPWELPKSLDAVVGVTAQLSPLISNDILERLRELPRLESVSLTGCSRLNDSSLVPLGRLKSLRNLALVDIPISDKGISELKTLEQLTSLTLSRNRINGTGLQQLVALPRLTSLSLDFNRLNPAGFRQLIQLPNVETLSLNGISTGMNELTQLADMPRLKKLSLSSAGLTPQDLSELQSRLPKVTFAP